MKKRNLQKRHIRNRWILAIFVLAIAVILTGFAFRGKPKADGATEYIFYTVKDGDTLWSICRELFGDEVDIRKKIDEIEELNGIVAGRIYAGRVLQVGKE